MRISGGDARGVRLKAAPRSRPTSELVRQAIFTSLAAAVPDARVLDLWCGSGAYALEAMSRGAASAVLVDREKSSLAVARVNATASRATEVVFHRRDAVRYVRTEAVREGPFDLVFCDPPYDAAPDVETLLTGLAPAVADEGRIVLELRKGGHTPEPPDGWTLEADRSYGDTRVLVFRRTRDAPGPARPDRPTERNNDERRIKRGTMTIACCPGTFDPVTNGHIDIVRRAASMFDEVYAAIAENPSKKPIFTIPERAEMLREATADLDNVKVVSFQGLTGDFCKSIGATVMVKGLRAVSDFDYEMAMAQMNSRMGVETAFVAARPEIAYVSASLMKEVVRYGGSIDGLVPPEVATKLAERLREI